MADISICENFTFNCPYCNTKNRVTCHNNMQVFHYEDMQLMKCKNCRADIGFNFTVAVSMNLYSPNFKPMDDVPIEKVVYK